MSAAMMTFTSGPHTWDVALQDFGGGEPESFENWADTLKKSDAFVSVCSAGRVLRKRATRVCAAGGDCPLR